MDDRRIQSTLQDIKKSLDKDNEAFLHSIQNEMEESKKMEMEKKKTRLTDSKNRVQELERLMCRIYEDMILEKIPNTRYEILNNQYETEQRELSKEIDGLEKAIKRYEKETDRAKKFICKAVERAIKTTMQPCFTGMRKMRKNCERKQMIEAKLRRLRNI